jgi:hypothetical protein
MFGISKRIAPVGAAVLAIGLFYSGSASAQATRTWISGVGDDANPCSRTAPCKTFQGTISKTATGGEINCIDPGGFGAVTIVKSISIICDDVEAGVLVSGTSGFIVNSTTAIVVISGIDFEGLGNGGGGSGIHGVNVVNAAAVHVRNSQIRGFRGGYGINFAPQAASAQLFVDNVAITDNGSSSNTATGGIILNPAAGMTATATITNTHISNNQNVGLRSDITGIVGSTINATFNNLTISNNNVGILFKAPAGTGTIKLMLTNSTVANNAGQGIIANGTGVSARVGNTTITNNGTGVSIPGNFASLQSYGDNRLDGNGTDGAFTTPVIPKK